MDVEDQVLAIMRDTDLSEDEALTKIEELRSQHPEAVNNVCKDFRVALADQGTRSPKAPPKTD